LEPATLTLESYVREGIDEYRQKSESPFPGTLSLTIYPTLTGFTGSWPGNSGDPIVLEGQDLSTARELKSQWWSRHARLLREDQALLEEMALVPLEKGSRPFPALLAELFQLLRSNLLSGPIKKTFSKTWH
jgi:hypothetical protein